jgi:hypothetical protein
MKTREQIITSMCHTWRHDYGLDKPEGDDFSSKLSAGTTLAEREFLWKQMAQIFDNDIAPHMKFVRPRLTKEERISKREDRRELNRNLGYSRIGADAFRRGR